MKAIEQLIHAIAIEANLQNRRWKIEPPVLARTAYANDLEQITALADYNGPSALRRFFADNYALFIVDVGSDWKMGRGTWLFAQAEVALLRASLAPDCNEDFMLMLVAGEGLDRDPEWIALAAEIERNDRVCRKLVWLPPLTADIADQSVKSFLGRSFLARPWRNESREAHTALDAATNPTELLGDWEAILDRNLLREPDYASLIRSLIEMEDK